MNPAMAPVTPDFSVAEHQSAKLEGVRLLSSHGKLRFLSTLIFVKMPQKIVMTELQIKHVFSLLIL